MCTLKQVNRTTNGILLYCYSRDTYQLLFNNLTFELSSGEMNGFVSYLNQIDIDYWEREYQNSVYNKKIPIPTLQSNFMILLCRKELEELRFLLAGINSQKILKPVDIDYQFVMN